MNRSRPYDRRFTTARFALAVVCGALSGIGACSVGGLTTPVTAPAETRGQSDTRPGPARPIDSYNDPVVRSLLREAAIERLETAVASDVPMLRANAIEALSAAPSRGERMVRTLLNDDNPGVRFAAAMMAGELRVRGITERLRQLLLDNDPRVRMASIYAIGRVGLPTDQTPLAEALRDERLGVRATAAFVLGEIGNPTAMPMLREAQRRVLIAGPVGPRANVERSLFRLQLAEALLKLGDTETESVVRSALYPGHREEVEAAVLAAQIIGELRLESGISQLVQIIEEPAPGDSTSTPVRQRTFLWPPELRLAAARSLAQMGELGGVFVADLCFDHENPLVRSQAAFVYGEAGRPTDLAKLELLMADDDPIVRTAAAASVLGAVVR